VKVRSDDVVNDDDDDDDDDDESADDDGIYDNDDRCHSDNYGEIMV